MGQKGGGGEVHAFKYKETPVYRLAFSKIRIIRIKWVVRDTRIRMRNKRVYWSSLSVSNLPKSCFHHQSASDDFREDMGPLVIDQVF